MKNLVLTHPTGEKFSLNNLQPYRAVRSASISANAKSNVLTITLESAETIDFPEGSYIDLLIYRYYIKGFCDVKVVHEKMHTYTLSMPGSYDFLEDTHIKDCDENGVYLIKTRTPVVGDLQYWGEIIRNNLNRNFRDPNFIRLGYVPQGTDMRYVKFSANNCLAAINEACSIFDVRYKITVAPEGDIAKYILSFSDVHEAYPIPLQYGMGKGLYEIGLNHSTNARTYTKVEILGGGDNVPSYYGKAQIELPEDQFPLSVIEDPAKVAKYGPKEKTFVNSSIFPMRVLTISDVFSDDPYSFECAELDFPFYDGDGFFLGGKAAMLDGELSGYQFEILRVRDKRIHVNIVKDGNVRVVPDKEEGSPFRFAVGNKFYVVEIPMPQTYVDEAVTRLIAWGQMVYARVSQPRVNYSVSFDPLFIKKAGVIPLVGMMMDITDERYGINKQVPINSISYDVLNDFRITNCDISDIDGDNFVTELVKTTRETYSDIDRSGLNKPATSNEVNVDALKDMVARLTGYKNWSDFKAQKGEGKAIWDDVDGFININALNVEALAADKAFVNELTVNRLKSTPSVKGWVTEITPDFQGIRIYDADTPNDHYTIIGNGDATAKGSIYMMEKNNGENFNRSASRYSPAEIYMALLKDETLRTHLSIKLIDYEGSAPYGGHVGVLISGKLPRDNAPTVTAGMWCVTANGTVMIKQ